MLLLDFLSQPGVELLTSLDGLGLELLVVELGLDPVVLLVRQVENVSSSLSDKGGTGRVDGVLGLRGFKADVEQGVGGGY